MTRTVMATLTLSFVVFALVLSCAEPTKYRVLTFFFDGVPEPGKARLAAETAAEGGGPVPGLGPAITRAEPPARYFTHPPYRDNRCGSCHDSESGQPIKAIRDGLCLACHAPIAAEPKFLHGPVAVNDCGVCHHHHESRYAKLLLTDPTATCLVCHDRSDLTKGEHHADLERRTCVDCHNPHGGNDRFFLKRTGP